MIEIIKHGLKKRYTRICPDCGCSFIFDKEDILDSQLGKLIYCPECNRQIML